MIKLFGYIYFSAGIKCFFYCVAHEKGHAADHGNTFFTAMALRLQREIGNGSFAKIINVR